MPFILEYRGVFRTPLILIIIAKSKNPLLVLASCAALFGATPAAAIGDFLDGVLAERGGAGAGMALRVEQSQYRGAGVRFDLLPLYLYEGEHVYLHASRAGLKMALGSESRVDAFVSRRLENSPVSNVPDSLSGIARRVPENDAGLGFSRRFGWGGVFAEVLHDVSGVSSGTEWRLGVESDRRSGALRLSPYLLFARRDARLNAYYFGVSAAEATATRQEYQP